MPLKNTIDLVFTIYIPHGEINQKVLEKIAFLAKQMPQLY